MLNNSKSSKKLPPFHKLADYDIPICLSLGFPTPFCWDHVTSRGSHLGVIGQDPFKDHQASSLAGPQHRTYHFA